ncbi:MAG: peptidylprolyl isomerase [Euryarchaeota archaeon]|nr:peptidylprolyl isomerase [Euryarchaeota archaeon]
MHPSRALLALPLIALVLSGCTQSEGPSSYQWAEVETSHGCFVIEFDREDAPRTVDNFARYAHEGFYEGTIFHRIMKGFMVQGGGFTEDGRQKKTHDPIPLEAKLPNDKWTVAMARTGDPDSATSQFFVNTKDNDFLDPGPGQDGYTRFGTVVLGREVVTALENVPTRYNGEEKSAPVDPPVIHGVTVYEHDEAKPDCTAGADTAVAPVDATPLQDCLAEPLQKDHSGLFLHFETTAGCFVAELHPEDAPRTVDNILALVASGHYDGLAFHRVSRDTLVQTGGYLENGTRVQAGEPVPLEAKRSNLKGTLAMARTPRDPDSATTQFFVNLKDNTRFDAGPQEKGYAVFGTVVRGLGTLYDISRRDTTEHPTTGFDNWPTPTPVIERVEIIEREYTPPATVIRLEAGVHQSDRADDGAWRVRVSGAEELVPVWFRHTGNGADTWSVSTLAPEDWTVTPSIGVFPLEPAGLVRWTGDVAPYAPHYPYAGQLLLGLQYHGDGVPEETDIVLGLTSERDPQETTELTLRLIPDAGFGNPVTLLGDPVEVRFEGRFTNGTVFDSGRFPTTIGSAETVPGFSFGIVGLEIGETTTLRMPPELAYGHHNPEGHDLAGMNGEWLVFEVEVLRRA